ncbi:hypothetical protein DY000_02026242 [Brassica cretica]|uniref:Uncharacterized protein n=1 Tax=Brassica cretica TaxID=69181 RepID=A0ABQ7EMR9_BRACR|nr:hypothetical protein DY000_02026242 [Brassica cretica]
MQSSSSTEVFDPIPDAVQLFLAILITDEVNESFVDKEQKKNGVSFQQISKVFRFEPICFAVCGIARNKIRTDEVRVLARV